MRPALRFGLCLVVLLALAPGARAQPDVPLPLDPSALGLPALDVPLPALPAENASVVVTVPGVAGLPPVSLALGFPLPALLPTPGDASPPSPPPLAPRPFATDGASAHERLAPASVLGPARGPDAPASGGFSTSAALPATPVDAAPATVGVALGVTALLAVLARLYSRFGRKDVLDAQPRARLHALLSQRPGATLSELAEATGLSRGAVVHHCQMLERHGLVASRQDGPYRRFFVAGPRVEPAGRLPTRAQRRVLDLLREKGPLTQAEIAALLGVTPQAVSLHLQRLRQEARVEAQAEGRERRWAISIQGP